MVEFYYYFPYNFMARWFIDQLYTYESWLHFTDHWHTQTSVLITVSSVLFLATDFNTGSVTVSLNYTLQISHTNSSIHSRTLATKSFLQPPVHTVLLLLRSCPLPRECVYWAYAQKRPLFIRLSRGRCIATVVYTTIYIYMYRLRDYQFIYLIVIKISQFS
jgi:hypothetical protein